MKRGEDADEKRADDKGKHVRVLLRGGFSPAVFGLVGLEDECVAQFISAVIRSDDCVEVDLPCR